MNPGDENRSQPEFTAWDISAGLLAELCENRRLPSLLADRVHGRILLVDAHGDEPVRLDLTSEDLTTAGDPQDGAPAASGLPEDVQRMLKRFVADALDRPTNARVLECRSDDGSEMRCRIISTLVRWGEQDLLVASMREAGTTEGIESSRVPERDYRQLFMNSGDGIIIASRSGKVVDVNPAGLELAGYSSADLEHGVMMDEIYADESDREALLAALGTKGMVHDYPVKIRRKGGELREVLLNASVRKSATGDIVGYHGVFRDVTESRKMEERLRHVAKLEEVGRLTGGLAHNFNNLLTIIGGSCEMLGLVIEEGGDPKGPMANIRQATRRASELASKVLTFSRRQEQSPVLVKLDATVADTERLLGRLIGPRMSIKRVLHPDTGAILVDPGQLDQVIINLVVNARDAMPSGGTLTIETRNVDLTEEDPRWIPQAEPGHFVLLRISDTGHGMDEETIKRVFEPFYTTKPRGEGTGLGLSTIYGTVTQSNGHVLVESRVGQGTTFSILFPRVEEVFEEPTPVRVKAEPRAGKGKGTVLVVDDEEVVRELISEFLHMYGYEALVASGGEEALALAENHEGDIDLLVTDLLMPGIQGKELAVRFRRLRPGTPVLFISGMPASALTSIGDGTDATELLPKPITPRELAEKVESMLGG